MTYLTRREFISITFAPLLVGRAVARATAFPHTFEPALPSALENPASQPEALLAGSEECPECRGLGAVTCPACDGTGLWNEASESAGFYQREAARATGHCAWCNEWGEIGCRKCEGSGSKSWQ